MKGALSKDMKIDSSMMYGTGNTAWKKFYAAKRKDELHGMVVILSGLFVLAGIVLISFMGV